MMTTEEEENELLFVTVLDYEECQVYCYKMPADYMDEPTFMDGMQEVLEMKHGDSFDFMVNFTHPNNIKTEWMINETFLEDED